MEVINVHKKVEVGHVFNPFHYQKTLSDLFPGTNPIIIRLMTDKIGRAYTKIKEFDTNTDDNTIIRNIIKQADVYAEFSTDFNKNSNRIQSDVIILGKKHNWSRFTDVVITKFNNFKRNYPRDVLDDHKKLLNAQHLAYDVDGIITRMYTPPPILGLTRTASLSVFYEDDIIIDPAKLAGIADFCYNMYRFRLDVHNFGALYRQLLSVGLLEVLYKTKVADVLQSRIRSELINFGRLKLQREALDTLSAFNLLQKILIQEYDSDSDVMTKFKNLSIRSVNQFYESIPKKDADKIRKIIGDRLADVYEKPCIHTDMVKQFLRGRKYMREKIIELCDINKNTMQYHCSKCSRRAFCQHSLDTAMKKSEFITKYKSPELSTRVMYYCKYCGEKIYKNETEYILNTADYVSMTKVRENSLARETNIDMFDNGLYGGISAAVGCFVIDYEFNVPALIRSIRYALYGLVHEQITALSIENDSQYELITKAYSFIFAMVYLRPLFMKDPKIMTKPRIPKRDSAYGQFINQEAGSKFGDLMASGRVLNIIKIAIVRLRDAGGTKAAIQAKTEKDDILEIVQSKKFELLYKYYNYGNPRTDSLAVFKKIVKHAKPTLATFDEGISVPNKNVNEVDKAIYTHLFDYSSPSCYVYRVAHGETLGKLSPLVYKPDIYNMLTKLYQEASRNHWVKS